MPVQPHMLPQTTPLLPTNTRPPTMTTHTGQSAPSNLFPPSMMDLATQRYQQQPPTVVQAAAPTNVIAREQHQSFALQQQENHRRNQLELKKQWGQRQQSGHKQHLIAVQEWVDPYTVESYSHKHEDTGLFFTTTPQEIEVQVLCIACAAGEMQADGRFAAVTDVDKAAIRRVCWLNTCRLANFRDAQGQEFPQCGGKDKQPSDGGCMLKHVNNLTPSQQLLSKVSYEKRSMVMA